MQLISAAVQQDSDPDRGTTTRLYIVGRGKESTNKAGDPISILC